MNNELQPVQIQNKILIIRNQQVMIDRDLAEMYGVETKRLNEQVKRNIERFPERFCFQLNDSEFENWKSQFATSNSDGYVDLSILERLAKKKKNVNVTIYTDPKTKLTAQDIQKFNAQYPTLTVKHTTKMHDRFLIIDNTVLYHIGASLKKSALHLKCLILH